MPVAAIIAMKVIKSAYSDAMAPESSFVSR